MVFCYSFDDTACSPSSLPFLVQVALDLSSVDEAVTFEAHLYTVRHHDHIFRQHSLF